MNKKRKSKTKRNIIIILLIVVLVAIAALSLRTKPTNYDSVQAKTGDINTYYSFSGNIETKNRQTVLSEKLMQISTINVKEGDIVKEGDVLYTTTTEDEIVAKIAGEVSSLSVEENAQLMAGMPIMEIVDYDNLQINVKVDEYDVSQLATGKDVTVYIGAIDKEIKGTIQTISKEGQTLNGVTYFTATIDLAKDDMVKVGMSAEVKLLSASVKDAITLPMKVIQFDENNIPFVYLKDDKKKLVATDIEAGINDGTTVEVLSGITKDDTVYYTDSTSTSGGMGFGSGMRGN